MLVHLDPWMRLSILRKLQGHSQFVSCLRGLPNAAALINVGHLCNGQDGRNVL